MWVRRAPAPPNPHPDAVPWGGRPPCPPGFIVDKGPEQPPDLPPLQLRL